MASDGYPAHYEKGFEIKAEDGVMENVFVAGAAIKDGRLVTSGGRVLGVSAVADTLKDAITLAYERVGKITFDNAYYRSDIGRRALAARED